MKTALIITVYNRPEYVRRCFESLKKADLKGITVIVVDDASKELPDNIFAHHILKHSHNAGIKTALLTGIEHAIELGCDTFINLDSDSVVKSDFVRVLLSLQKQFPNNIVSGFNSTTGNRNPVMTEGDNYLYKKYANGINMCFGKQLYLSVIKPALKGANNWDYEATSATKGCIISKPSVVQHIGFQSSIGHVVEIPDYACDFKEFHLPDVTLFGIDGRKPREITRAAEISTMNIKFGAEVIITEKLFEGHEAYSDFCINRMPDYIKTSHALIIHADGYVLKPEAWQDEWLEYDYIGAPWDWYKDDYQNGNGGFNLRSKRLMELVREMKPTNTHPEDSVICRDLRPQLEEQGIKFAPIEVCRAFSIEGWASANRTYNGQFGFHGGVADLSMLPKWMQLERPKVLNRYYQSRLKSKRR